MSLGLKLYDYHDDPGFENEGGNHHGGLRVVIFEQGEVTWHEVGHDLYRKGILIFFYTLVSQPHVLGSRFE